MILLPIVLACFTMAGIYHLAHYLQDMGERRRTSRGDSPVDNERR